LATRVYSEQCDTHTLRQIGLRHLYRLEARTFHDWAQAVREDFGSVGERRIYRVMRWLIDNRLVVKSDETLTQENGGFYNEVSLYLRVSDEVPRIMWRSFGGRPKKRRRVKRASRPKASRAAEPARQAA
jgi:hypothetical protein